MSPNPLAARADAQTPTGGVLVVADTTTVSDSSSALPARLPPRGGAGMGMDAVRIHRGLRDTP